MNVQQGSVLVMSFCSFPLSDCEEWTFLIILLAMNAHLVARLFALDWGSLLPWFIVVFLRSGPRSDSLYLWRCNIRIETNTDVCSTVPRVKWLNISTSPMSIRCVQVSHTWCLCSFIQLISVASCFCTSCCLSYCSSSDPIGRLCSGGRGCCSCFCCSDL